MLRALLDRLRRWAQSDFLADSERASDREGYLSYRAEWHAAAWGMAAGIVAVVTGQLVVVAAVVGWLFSRAGDRTVPGYIPYPAQFKKESAYLLGHLVAGLVVGLGLRVALSAVGVDVPALDPTGAVASALDG